MAKLKHIAIASQEPKKTAEFYRSVFGLKQVGNVDGDNAEGVYLTDGHISIAILKFKNETLAGLDYGVEYSGLHHIGFQVDDMSRPTPDCRLPRCSPVLTSIRCEGRRWARATAGEM